MDKRPLSYHMLIHYLLAAFSFAVTFIWLRSLPWSAASAFISIFLDADHLVDYWLANGFNLDYRRFVRETFEGGLYFVKSKKVIVPLHSWEFLVLLFLGSEVLSTPQLGVAFALGFIPHLLWDQKTYAKRPLMYSFIFRVFSKFDLKKVCGEV